MRKIIYLLLAITLLASGVSNAATKAQSIQFLLSQVRTSTSALAGGKAYFYAAGTTTSKAVWLDRGKATQAANPYTLDANATAQLFGDGLYRIVIKDAAGVTKYDRDGLRFAELAGDTVANVLDYGSGTLAEAIAAIGNTPTTLAYGTDQTLAANITIPSTLELLPLNGAVIHYTTRTIAFVGPVTARWPNAQMFDGTGAVTGLKESIPEWWGVGTANDSPSFNKSILAVAAAGGKVTAKSAAYNLTTHVMIPSGVSLDLNHATITGPGIGSATSIFQGGYISGGALLTNVGTAEGAHYILGASVKNGIIKNCGKAFDLFNWIDNCEVSNIQFTDCTYAIYSSWSWYVKFHDLHSRGSASGATNAAFHFDSFVNVNYMESIFVNDRVLGIEVIGAANGLNILNSGAEACGTGLKIDRGVSFNGSGPIKVDTFYAEGCTVAGIDIGPQVYNTTISNSWFNTCAIGVKPPSGGSVDVQPGNRFTDCTVNVALTGGTAEDSSLGIVNQQISDNGLPVLPAGYSAGPSNNVQHNAVIFSSATGDPLIKSQVHGGSLIAFEHEGQAGEPKTGTVAFATHASSGGTSFNVVIDTKINYQKYSALLVYRFEIGDNVGTYQLFGSIFGDTAKPSDATGKTVTVSNQGGFVRLTIGTFSHPSGTYGCTGIVRHL